MFVFSFVFVSFHVGIFVADAGDLRLFIIMIHFVIIISDEIKINDDHTYKHKHIELFINCVHKYATN